MDWFKVFVGAGALSVVGLVGCESAQTVSDDPTDDSAIVILEGEPIDPVSLSDAPIKGDSAVMYVEGLGCPMCATNIDLSIGDLAGVDSVKTSLKDGAVRVRFSGPYRPSERDLAMAVHNSGFGVLKVESE